MSDVHQSVMFDEALAGLAIRPDGCYLDGTFGRGGHSSGILARLDERGCLLALDKDTQAVAYGRERFADDPRFQIEQSSFANLAEVVERRGLSGKVCGLLLDLGVSSPQLDDPGRGFSFLRDGPLDMRMDPSNPETAASWLAAVDEAELAQVLKEFGEERFARRIARALVAARGQQPITRTAQLADLIAAAVPTREPGKHPATRSFQAIRIRINNELDEIKQALAQAMQVLSNGARLVVISFHSLEDRIVKRVLREAAQGDPFPKGLPIPDAMRKPGLRLIGSARRPDAVEVERNPRARSAVMRIAERIA